MAYLIETDGTYTTLWRFKDRISRESMVKIVEVFVDRWLQSYTLTSDQIILDFDATDAPI